MGIDKGIHKRPAGSDTPEDEMSPVPGLDWPSFRNYVVRALAGDGAVPASILTRVGAALANGERNLEDRDRRWWRDFFWKQAIFDSLRRIDDGIGELDDMAAWYREQAEQMRREMEQLARRMGERSEFIGEAYAIIDDWKKDGKLDRERAIEALRKRGIEANERMTDLQILELLQEQQRRDLEANARDSDRYDHLDKWQQDYDDEANDIEKRAEHYRDERQRIMDDYGPEVTLTDAERAERQRRLDELEQRVGEDVVNAAARQEQNRQAQHQQGTAISRSAAKERIAEESTLSSLFGESADPAQETHAQPDNEHPDGTAPMIATNLTMPEVVS